MAFFDTTWYSHSGDMTSTGWFAVPMWTASTAYTAGQLVRQRTTPALNAERVFVCIIAGTSGSTEPGSGTWTVTRGARNTDGTVTWQECTGAAAVNGDLTNTPTWAQAKAISTAVTLGAIIQRNSGGSYQICSVAGNSGASEPAGFSNTAGVTTVDSGVTWTSLGPPSNFAAWGAPHARLQNALATNWGAAGNNFWVADNSAETNAAAIGLSPPGTMALPCNVYSIDHTLAMPPTAASLKAGASFNSSLAGNNSLGINLVGNSTYWYGFNFICSVTAGGNNVFGLCQIGQAYFKFDTCTFQLTGSGATPPIGLGGIAVGNVSQVDFVNCLFYFANVGQRIAMMAGTFNWRNSTLLMPGSVVPTNLFAPGNGPPGTFLFEGCDLSAFTGNFMSNAGGGANLTFKDCKLASASTFIGAAAATGTNINIDVTRCDSGTSVYRNERHTVYGDQITDATVYRTGGAADGGVGISHRVVPSTFVRNWRPFNALPLVVWCDFNTGSHTATLYGFITTNSAPNNAQVWADLEFLGDAASPRGSFQFTGAANPLSSSGALAVADTSVWNAPARVNGATKAVGDLMTVASNPGRLFYVSGISTGILTSPEPAGYASATDTSSSFADGGTTIQPCFRFAIALTFAPRQKGYLYGYPKVASATTQRVYFDPQLIVA